MPSGIAIDYISQKLIWCDFSSRTIQYSNLDGSNSNVLFTTEEEKAPFQIVVAGPELYWSSPNSNNSNRITLYESNSAVSFQVAGVLSTSLYGITVEDENKVPITGIYNV